MLWWAGGRGREGEGRVALSVTQDDSSGKWALQSALTLRTTDIRSVVSCTWCRSSSLSPKFAPNERALSDVLVFFFYEQKGILAIVIFVSTLMLVIDHVGSTGAQTTGDNSLRCSGVIMFYCVFKCFLCVFLCLLQHKLHNWEKINKWIVLTWPAKVNTG